MSTVERVVAARPRSRIFSAQSLRLWHAYISAFIAPTIVFFALTGAIQVLNLHEAHGDYRPFAAVSALARLHKQQVLAPERRRGRPPGAGSPEAGPAGPGGGGASDGPGGPERAEPPVKPAVLALKWLFVAEALALVLTTGFGVWIGVTHPKRARVFVALTVAGVVVPVLLIVA